jgi:hypothetical protein
MIESIDEEAFGRCCEFVYSGDYSAPCPVLQSPGNDNSQSENRETQCQEKANRWDSSSLNWNLFHPKGLLHNDGLLLAKLGHTPRSGSEKDLRNYPFTSYAAVFLGHAEIHRFGVRTGWLSLSVLFFYRLLGLLENFTLLKNERETSFSYWYLFLRKVSSFRNHSYLQTLLYLSVNRKYASPNTEISYSHRFLDHFLE